MTFGFCNDFMSMTPNTQEINVTMNFMKIKTFCASEAMKKKKDNLKTIVEYLKTIYLKID